MDSLVKLMGGGHPVRELDLTNNKITCEGAEQLAKFLAGNSNLKCRLRKVVLSLNKIKRQGCEAICKVMIS